MTTGCAELDEFFDGELAADQADEFRDHLAGCERCQRMLLGRMQEDIAAHVDVVGAYAAAGAASSAAAIAPSAATAIAPAAATANANAAVTPMLAPPRRGGLRRAAIYLGPVLAAAAAAAALWFPHAPAGFQASLDIDHAAVTQRSRSADPPPAQRRGRTAGVGDVVKLRVQGERHQAIWVYLDDRELILVCPGNDTRCTTAHGELALQLPLPSRGRYAFVSLGSSEAIPPPQPTYEEAIVAAKTAGAHYQVDDVNVDVPPSL